MKLIYHIPKKLEGQWLNLSCGYDSYYGISGKGLPDGVTVELIQDGKDELAMEYSLE